MAHYRHLPVAPLLPLQRFTAAVMPFAGKWEAALGLAVHLEHAERRFPRYHKYTLGGELRHGNVGGGLPPMGFIAAKAAPPVSLLLYRVLSANTPPSPAVIPAPLSILSTSHRGPT